MLAKKEYSFLADDWHFHEAIQAPQCSVVHIREEGDRCYIRCTEEEWAAIQDDVVRRKREYLLPIVREKAKAATERLLRLSNNKMKYAPKHTP